MARRPGKHHVKEQGKKFDKCPKCGKRPVGVPFCYACWDKEHPGEDPAPCLID